MVVVKNCVVICVQDASRVVGLKIRAGGMESVLWKKVSSSLIRRIMPSAKLWLWRWRV